ncbi:MAG: type IV toxin-antitoxin system AbiEi family antitoxin domain-containing protein [Burkholderiales bacterium]|nr:type IV toxin-antitoxin system AbiEi family antitoxin domain-containing protein [Burkholderiales bacterium]
MNTLPESIVLHAQSLPEGGVLSPKEFLHLGSRAAVDQALSRLTKEGKLLRVGRGTYVTPVSSRFGTRAPAPEKVVKSLAAQSGETVAPHGAMAANTLGLTQQVPIREVYLTSGRTRKLKLGRSEVLVKHVPRWMLALGTGQAGAAVRALAWMGPAHVSESLATLHRTLPNSEWRALTASRAALPSWMARAIGEEAVRG